MPGSEQTLSPEAVKGNPMGVQFEALAEADRPFSSRLSSANSTKQPMPLESYRPSAANQAAEEIREAIMSKTKRAFGKCQRVVLE